MSPPSRAAGKCRLARSSLLLYAVTDRRWLVPEVDGTGSGGAGSLAGQIEEAIAGGATMVQLREKGLGFRGFLALAREAKRVTDAYGVPLIVNDDVAVALASGAAGLHIGQGDGDVSRVRALVGGRKILGVSVRTEGEAIEAERNGADYLGVGAIFPTGTKDDARPVALSELALICAAVRVPVVAIGGITAENASLLSGLGIAGIAAVSALFSDPFSVRDRAAVLAAAARSVCSLEPPPQGRDG